MIVVVAEAINHVLLSFLILHCVREAGHVRICLADAVVGGGGSCVVVIWRRVRVH